MVLSIIKQDDIGRRGTGSTLGSFGKSGNSSLEYLQGCQELVKLAKSLKGLQKLGYNQDQLNTAFRKFLVKNSNKFKRGEVANTASLLTFALTDLRRQNEYAHGGRQNGQYGQALTAIKNSGKGDEVGLVLFGNDGTKKIGDKIEGESDTSFAMKALGAAEIAAELIGLAQASGPTMAALLVVLAVSLKADENKKGASILLKQYGGKAANRQSKVTVLGAVDAVLMNNDHIEMADDLGSLAEKESDPKLKVALQAMKEGKSEEDPTLVNEMKREVAADTLNEMKAESVYVVDPQGQLVRGDTMEAVDSLAQDVDLDNAQEPLVVEAAEVTPAPYAMPYSKPYHSEPIGAAPNAAANEYAVPVSAVKNPITAPQNPFINGPKPPSWATEDDMMPKSSGSLV